MSRRTAAWLAWSLAALSGAMFVGGGALTVLSFSEAPATQPSSDWGTASALGGLVIFLPFLAFPLVGALVASRRPHNPHRLDLPGRGPPLDAHRPWRFHPHRLRTVSREGRRADPVALDTPVGLLGIYLILLFPDGRLPSRRWRPLAWLSGVVMVLASVVITLAPGPLEGHPGVRNPYGLEGLEGHTWAESAGVGIPALLPVCILASAPSLVLRYRRSGG